MADISYRGDEFIKFIVVFVLFFLIPISIPFIAFCCCFVWDAISTCFNVSKVFAVNMISYCLACLGNHSADQTINNCPNGTPSNGLHASANDQMAMVQMESDHQSGCINGDDIETEENCDSPPPAYETIFFD